MLCSPVDEVDNIWWPKRVTGRPVKAESVVVIADGGRDGLMVVKLAGGGFISSRDISKFAYLPGQYPWMASTIKALVKLGAITQKAADDHMAVCARNTKRDEDRYNAETFKRLAEETGLGLSASQRRFVEQHSGARV